MPIFRVFRRGGDPGPLILAGAQNIGRDLRGTMAKMRFFKANCHSLHMASSSALDRVCYRFLSCNVHKCPELRGNCVSYIHSGEICNMKVKIGVSEKGPKYISGAAPIMILVFFGVAPRFREKTVFPTSTKFR